MEIAPMLASIASDIFLPPPALREELLEKSIEHIVYLTLIPVLLAVGVGVPLGVLISRSRMLRQPVLSVLGLVQTLPSLALLALLLPLLGIGLVNAIAALTLYALFPIVMNTVTGLTQVSAESLEAAEGLGFSRRQRMWMVELPLATPVIVAGIRTAAVIDVGVATLATFVSAGGLGDLIMRGIRLQDTATTVQAALAAMLLALVVFFTIGTIERLLRRGHA